MKRWPAITSFILFIALCVSAAYWAMQFFQPPIRSIVAPPAAPQQAPELSAAAGLLGGSVQASAASNFRLTGIIIAGHPSDSIAIIAADGKPARPFRVNAEIKTGVRVQEIQPGYVLLQQNEKVQRLELPAAKRK
jgi:general secretion pathway protein C